jgi:hypothetical protein
MVMDSTTSFRPRTVSLEFHQDMSSEPCHGAGEIMIIALQRNRFTNVYSKISRSKTPPDPQHRIKAAYNIEILKLTHLNRSSHRISGHWPPSPIGGKPSAKAVPDENICTKHCGCEVSFLVFLDEVTKGQEGEWRDRQLERGGHHWISNICTESNHHRSTKSAH